MSNLLAVVFRGNALLPLCVISLALAFLANPNSIYAQDVEFVGLLKSEDYSQDSEALPALENDPDFGPFHFQSFIDTDQEGLVSAATLQIPGGSVIDVPTNDGEFSLEHPFAKKNRLDVNYPDGDYILTINTLHDGTPELTLNLTGDRYPNIPRIMNLLAAQSIDASTDFTLSWDTFSDGSPEDIILLEIDEIQPFDRETVYESGSMNAGSTNINLPMDTFRSGRIYEGSLTFVKVTAHDESYAPAIAAYLRKTRFPMRTTWSSEDNEAPYLVAVWPPVDATDVPLNSVVILDFVEPMDTNVFTADSLSWTNADAGSFSYQWSPDATRLFCVYNSSLPANTTIGWMINPPEGSANLRDLAGNPVPPLTGGKFSTGSTNVNSGTDLTECNLIKVVTYCQRDESGAIPTGINLAAIELEQSVVGSVINFEILTPTGERIIASNFSREESFDREWRHASAEILDRFVPNGDFLVTVDTAHDGVRSLPLKLDGNGYPTVPALVNYEAAQEIDPSQPFALHWNAISEGTTNDLVFVDIEDELGETILESPDVGQAGVLNGMSPPLFEIPAGTLDPGSSYEVELSFAHLTDINRDVYEGAVGRAAYVNVVRFGLQTITNMSPRPRLTIGRERNMPLELTLTNGLDRAIYAIEVTQDFEEWYSTRLGATYGNGFFQWYDYGAQEHAMRFYQVRRFNLIKGIWIRGHVVDSIQFNPVPGALVSTTLGDHRAVSDYNGNFSLATRVEGDFSETLYTIEITADGFKAVNLTGFWGHHPPPELIVLEPLIE